MKTKITFLKLSLVALILLTSSTAWSATYYVCSGAELSLDPGLPPTGITYMWDVRDALTDASIENYPRTGVPITLPATGTYIINLISSQTTPSAVNCAPDLVTNTFIVLPAISLVLDEPTYDSYCGKHSDIKSSDIAVLPILTLPQSAGSDLIYEYSYTVSVNDGTATTEVDGSTIGTINQGSGTYTLEATTPGTYTITGKVKYLQASTFTNKLLGTTGCLATSTTTKVVTIVAPPAAPSIIISAN